MVLQRKRHLPDIFKELPVTLGPPSRLWSLSDGVMMLVVATATRGKIQSARTGNTVVQASPTERWAKLLRDWRTSFPFPTAGERLTFASILPSSGHIDLLRLLIYEKLRFRSYVFLFSVLLLFTVFYVCL